MPRTVEEQVAVMLKIQPHLFATATATCLAGFKGALARATKNSCTKNSVCLGTEREKWIPNKANITSVFPFLSTATTKTELSQKGRLYHHKDCLLGDQSTNTC